MKSTINLLMIFLMGVLISCSESTKLKQEYPQSMTLSIENTCSEQVQDAIVRLNVDDLKSKVSNFNPDAFVILSAGNELPSQSNDLNGDGSKDEILCLINMAPNEKKEITVRYATSGEQVRDYPKRTQAELSHKVGGKFVDRKYEGGAFQNVSYLRVPPEHTDHSFYIRYEGPGWESDKVGYRFYLDWRNAIDVYGKKIPDMVLQNVGLDGFDSYHEMADWGVDVLKVGNSLGCGSIGMWYNNKAERVAQTDSIICRIVSNGPIESQIETKYFGWKAGKDSYNLISNLSINAGSRLTKHYLQIDGKPQNLCTGIAKNDSAQLIQSVNKESGFLYLATYGRQTLQNDNLGMAVIFSKENFIQIDEDQLSHVVILKPADGVLDYYFLAAWEKEPGGIATEADFVSYLESTVSVLDSEILVKF